MGTQEQERGDTSAKKTNSSNSSKEGILKQQSGDRNITDISKNKEMFERVGVEGTPFQIIGNEKLGYWLSMGAFRLSEPKPKKVLVEMVETRDWELIINVLCAIMAGKDMEQIERATKKQA